MEKENIALVVFDSFLVLTLKVFSYFLIAPVVIYVIVRLNFGVFDWLMTGTWYECTTCSLFELFCAPATIAVGLNKILFWLGSNDPIYLFSFSAFVGLVTLSRTKELGAL